MMEENGGKQNIRRAIVETIAFFDLFFYPLTINEILKYLRVKSDYLEISKELELLIEKKIIRQKEALFFLESRESIVEERKKRYNYSDRKFKIAQNIIKYFRFIPWIKMIAVVNLIGRDNLRDSSDIDLFIVSEKKRLWLTRFFTVIIAKFLNKRPQINNTRDKICLSFFVSENNLDLQAVREGEDDLYFSYWLLNIASIYSRDNTFEKFMKSNEKILSEFPNYFIQDVSSKRKTNVYKNNFFRNNFELFFGGLESRIRKFQLKIMPRDLLNLLPQKKGVLISDNIIKLHLKDKRNEFYRKYNEKISKIKI